MKKILGLIALTGSTMVPNASAADILVNGGFETGDFTGWSATSNGIGELTPWAVSVSGGGFFGTAPLSGSYDAYNGFDGDSGLTYDLNQTVFLPSGFNAELTTNHRIVYDSLGIPSTLDRVVEINVLDNLNNLLAILYTQNVTMNGAGPTDLGWITLTFDLSAFAGQTISLNIHEFIPESFTGPANIEFDNISLDIARVGVPETGSSLILLGISSVGLAISRRRMKF